MKKWKLIILLPLVLVTALTLIPHRQGFSQQDAPFVLEQNHPNPFSDKTELDFSLREAGHVKILIHNMLGKEIQLVTDEDFEVGPQKLFFYANSLPSGQYTYTLYFSSKTNAAKQTKKMYLVR